VKTSLNLLLDTHALLWALARPRALTSEARSAVTSPENEVTVSAASVWEVAIKQALGRLDVPREFLAALRNAGFTPLPVTWEHGFAAGSLPPHHRDPFDRMLVAQARLEGLTVVTRDPIFARYDVPVLAA
jgi:PIN domain nuclease of toxin-antitoxin system